MATYIEGAIRGYLMGVTGVKNLIGNRLYFQKAPQKATLPCVIYFAVSDPHGPLFMDSSGTKTKAGQRIFQFTCISDQSLESLNLQQQVMNALRWYRGATQGFTIEWIEIENMRQRYDSVANEYLNDVDARVEYYEA